LGGLVGEEKAPAETRCELWLWNRSVVGGCTWMEIEGGFIRIFEDGKEFDLFKGRREAV
jgi:hypothetical protein